MTDKPNEARLSLANEVAARYGRLSRVEAVALGGSLAAGAADQDSDVDLYVYFKGEISLRVRKEMATVRAEYVEVNNQFWEPGDEWIDSATGIHVDVMFRAVGWIEEELDRVLRRHEASVGYSTCLWYNVLSSQALYDRNGWFHRFQQDANQPYPEELRQAIIAKNYPILRRTMSSYVTQLERAVARGDMVSINHRSAALLASYFDILFALNRMPHPGEKRLVEIASEECPKVPDGIREQVSELIRSLPRVDQTVIDNAQALISGLDDLLSAERLDVT